MVQGEGLGQGVQSLPRAKHSWRECEKTWGDQGRQPEKSRQIFQRWQGSGVAGVAKAVIWGRQLTKEPNM